MLERPEDPGREPFPYIWVSWAVHFLQTMIAAQHFCFAQCMWAAPGVKPTCMLSNNGSLSALLLRCSHGKKAHVALRGRKQGGGWNTTASAAYP